jgi:hypothetical protein
MSAASGKTSASSFRSSSARLSSAGEILMSTAASFAGRPRSRASCASRRHVARPIPLAAPVTRARIAASFCQQESTAESRREGVDGHLQPEVLRFNRILDLAHPIKPAVLQS